MQSVNDPPNRICRAFSACVLLTNLLGLESPGVTNPQGSGIPRGQPFTYDLTQSVVGAFRISGCLQPRAVAELLSHEVGIDVDTLQRITEHLPWGFQPVTPTVIADQQKIADTFLV